MLRRLVCCFAVSAWLCSAAVADETGVDAKELHLGMVNAQSGPAAGLGKGMLAGAQAYFQRVNAAGGVHGRRLVLLVRDDGYEPARTARLTEELIDSRSVFALFGYVGTPTSRAAMPATLAAGVPYLFPFSGAEVLREPLHHWVFNVRASYFAETELLAAHMTEELKLSRVALLMQNDSFGETVKGGLAGALLKRGLHVEGEARILRNSLQIGEAVRQLLPSQPQAIFFVGTYKQLAAAIREARALGMQARFFSVSFVGTDSFIAEAGADAEGVYISQVVPPPEDASLPLVRDYQADMQGPLGYASLEGYIGAAVLVEALRRIGPQPTRAQLVDALESLDLDLGGFQVRFGPDDHQGSDAVYLTRIEQGRAVPVQRQP
ncbi:MULTISPECIES: ABC transporter substrate-binding protein [unclassified Pseudomonas]|uniref:ABC transporter substrate-binding protein n=1 Tax=unclassified Pseudomonas TaxID=196821 RepID=UPI00244D2CCC|nr:MULTISPECIES: ABC transporter substrate-binding protein [unclassified Pseudomonas]MDG9923834.1 ABC transporter substrate-binding protein [Pseudomonas sp. GD04045]MDH0035891.1 ABC transporter substrate-binding protein [Pseudomonas sp. GD04019]